MTQVVVAVIDTGVQLDHPDLQDMLWTNAGEIPGNGAAWLITSPAADVTSAQY